MLRSLVKSFAPLLIGALLPLSLIASEISKPISAEIVTHQTVVETSQGDFKFELHYTPKDKVFVARVEEILKRDAARLADYFQYVPKDAVHIMLSHTNQANGSATVFPWNLINLYAFPPIGNEHLMSIDTWVRGLVLHELVHILHMDQTRGVLKGLRTVFGSIGKLGGVVPRWFSEGVAVWAETHFTEGGRLRDPILRYEMQQLLLDPNYCQNLDCLDNPGVFPGGQLAYWVGGAFIDYLEREKAGTASCLIRSNSHSLPFFLNSAFRTCTGDFATIKFKKFRRELKALAPETKALGQKEWAPSYQARFLMSERGVVRYGRTRRDPELTLTKSNGEMEFIARSPGHLETFLPTTAKSRQEKFALATVMAFESGYSAREIWRYDLEKLEFTTKLDFPHDVESAFYLGDEKYLTLRYDDHHWIVETGTIKERQIVKSFALLEHVRMPRVVQSKAGTRLIYSLSAVNAQGLEEYQYQMMDIQDDKAATVTLLANSQPLHVIGHCAQKVYVQTKEQTLELDLSGDLARAFSVKGSVLLLDGSESEVAYLTPDKGMQYGSCQSFSQSLQGPSVRLAEIKSDALEAPVANSELAAQSYPSARHFIPQYWMFDYISGDNLDAWKIYTTLSDPIMRHTLGLSLDYYPELAKTVPTANYTYSRGYLRLLAGYDKNYTQSSITKREDTSEVLSFGVGFDRWWGRYNLALTSIYAMKETTDFISERQVDEVSLNLSFFRMGQFYDSFLGDTHLQARGLRSAPENFENYWGQQYRLSQTFYLLPRTHLHVLGTYGKLEKNNFISGVLYGGGPSNYTTTYFHEFYGIAYSDAFGNEISTGRAQIDITAYNAYSAGGGLFPFYLKELHLLAGTEFIHADRIFIEGGFLRNQELRSHHGGLRVLADLFYLIPIQSDLLYVSTENPFGPRLNDFVFLVRGNFSL